MMSTMAARKQKRSCSTVLLQLPLIAVLCCWTAAGQGSDSPPAPTVHIGSTVITGLRSTTTTGKPVNSFIGIRYGEAPTGQRRFKPPEPAALPREVEARRYGAMCPQVPAYDPARMSEDCLFLNVFVPAQDVSEDRLVPVLVWIHGGGFIIGTADIYEGEELAGEGGVVVVNLNYRLGPFGFLSTGDAASRGNFGLLDQRLALRWVHEHIGRFGGDRARVTLSGASAGAASTAFHALSPLSRHLFRHVILFSGSATAPWARVSPAHAMQAAEALGQAVGCGGGQRNVTTVTLVSCLRTLTVDTIVAASRVVFPDKVGLSLVDYTWVPVEDGEVVGAVDTVTPFPGQVLAGLLNNEGATLNKWIVPRISAIIPDAGDLVKDGQFYRRHFLPSMLKQTYPDLVPLPWPTRHAPEEAWEDPPFLEALQRLQCAYPLGSGGGVDKERTQELFGDQAFLQGTVRFLDKFCCRGSQREGRSSFLYFVDYQTKRPGVKGFHHLDDLVFLFGFNISLNHVWLGYEGHVTDLDLQMARDMRQLYVNFIKTGDPNLPERPQGWPLWTPYTSKGQNYLHLSPSPAVLSRVKAEKMALWLTDIPRVLSSTNSSTDQWQCQTSASSRLHDTRENSVVVVLVLMLFLWTA